MRKVKIEYNDGHTAEFNTIEAAASALNCSNPAIQRLANGLASTLLKAHGIKSVELSMPKTHNGGVRKRNGRYHVKCTNEQTGEVIIAKTLKEAAELTHWPRTVTALHYACDRNEFRHGWKYDSIPLAMQKDSFHFSEKTQIPEETVAMLYRMARYLLITWTLPMATKEDCVSYAVSHTASEISEGKYDEVKDKFKSYETWLWCRVRQWLSKQLHKEIPWARLRQEKPEELDMTHEDWLNSITPADEQDMAFLEDIPEYLRPLAECIVAGMNRLEIDKELGISEHRRSVMTEELREWYRHNGKGR